MEIHRLSVQREEQPKGHVAAGFPSQRAWTQIRLRRLLEPCQIPLRRGRGRTAKDTFWHREALEKPGT